MGAVKPRKANRMLNDMKLAIEHDGMNKNKFATQMEELRRAADHKPQTTMLPRPRSPA